MNRTDIGRDNQTRATPVVSTVERLQPGVTTEIPSQVSAPVATVNDVAATGEVAVTSGAAVTSDMAATVEVDITGEEVVSAQNEGLYEFLKLNIILMTISVCVKKEET